jgi:long-subunit fatty acid transport protein
LYNQRGYEGVANFTDISGQVLGTETYESRYNYLSMPIAAAFNFGNQVYGFGKIGVMPSWLAQAKFINPTFDDKGHNSGSQTNDMTDDTQRFDLAGLIEVGGGYQIEEKYRVFISIAYQHSFTSYTASNAVIESRHRVLSLSLGLKYKLKE